jgi:hypothetical protein
LAKRNKYFYEYKYSFWPDEGYFPYDENDHYKSPMVFFTNNKNDPMVSEIKFIKRYMNKYQISIMGPSCDKEKNVMKEIYTIYEKVGLQPDGFDPNIGMVCFWDIKIADEKEEYKHSKFLN